jgi:membrane protease YdiL (CAAX protease family)
MELLDSALPSSAIESPPEPRRSVFRDVPWRWSHVLIGFAPMALMTVASVVINPAWLPVGPHWFWLPIVGIYMAWLFVYPLWIVRCHARLPGLPRPRAVFVEALCALLATVVVMIALMATFSVLFSLFGDRARTTMPWKQTAGSPYWYDSLGFLVLAICIAPLAEEVFFRGMLYSALRRRLHVVVAAPLQAVVFGVSHRFGPADTAGVVLIGLALALLYEWRRTLLAPVLMHAMVNAVAAAIMAQSIAADAAAPRLGVYGDTHERGCVITDVVPGSAADLEGCGSAT